MEKLSQINMASTKGETICLQVDLLRVTFYFILLSLTSNLVLRKENDSDKGGHTYFKIDVDGSI